MSLFHGRQKPQATYEPGEKLNFMEAMAEIVAGNHIYESGKLQNSGWMQNQRISTVKGRAMNGHYQRAIITSFVYPMHSAITLARSVQVDTARANAPGIRTLFRGAPGTVVAHYGTPPRAYEVEFGDGITATLIGPDMRPAPAKEAS